MRFVCGYYDDMNDVAMVHAFLQSCFGSSLVLNIGGILKSLP